MGVRGMDRFLERWEMDTKDLRRRMVLAPTPRERERWQALWLLAQGYPPGSNSPGRRHPHPVSSLGAPVIVVDLQAKKHPPAGLWLRPSPPGGC